MSEIETTVMLNTLCGCTKDLKWYGIPPREVRVPIKRKFPSFAETETMPAEGVRIRVFKMTDSAHPVYRFDEEAEP